MLVVPFVGSIACKVNSAAIFVEIVVHGGGGAADMKPVCHDAKNRGAAAKAVAWASGPDIVHLSWPYSGRARL